MKHLRALREAQGWTRAELARRAGMNAATVGAIEAGRLAAYPSQLRKLAAALGVPSDEAASLDAEVSLVVRSGGELGTLVHSSGPRPQGAK
jgi:transcriptional regulator with XRE-family HTH domain